MIPLITLVLILSTAPFELGSLELLHKEICRDQDEFQIIRKHIYLPETHFTKEQLQRFFSDFLSHNQELHIIASCDLDFLQRLYGLPVALTGRDRDIFPIIVPLKSSKPQAYFHKIGENAFFGFVDQIGDVRWVVLQGEDVFRRTFEGTMVYYAGQYFYGRTQVSCRVAGRSASLVADNLAELDLDQILRIVAYYDALFGNPGDLHLRIFGSFRDAALVNHFTVPNLNGDLTPDHSQELGRTAGYVRLGDYREVHINEGAGTPPLVSRKLSEEDLKRYKGQ